MRNSLALIAVAATVGFGGCGRSDVGRSGDGSGDGIAVGDLDGDIAGDTSPGDNIAPGPDWLFVGSFGTSEMLSFTLERSTCSLEYRQTVTVAQQPNVFAADRTNGILFVGYIGTVNAGRRVESRLVDTSAGTTTLVGSEATLFGVEKIALNVGQSRLFALAFERLDAMTYDSQSGALDTNVSSTAVSQFLNGLAVQSDAQFLYASHVDNDNVESWSVPPSGAPLPDSASPGVPSNPANLILLHGDTVLVGTTGVSRLFSLFVEPGSGALSSGTSISTVEQTYSMAANVAAGLVYVQESPGAAVSYSVDGTTGVFERIDSEPAPVPPGNILLSPGGECLVTVGSGGTALTSAVVSGGSLSPGSSLTINITPSLTALVPMAIFGP